MRFHLVGTACRSQLCGVNFKCLGIKFESLGIKFESLGIKFESLGIKFESLGIKSESLGIKSRKFWNEFLKRMGLNIKGSEINETTFCLSE
jgi:hypothetical protein